MIKDRARRETRNLTPKLRPLFPRAGEWANPRSQANSLTLALVVLRTTLDLRKREREVPD